MALEFSINILCVDKQFLIQRHFEDRSKINQRLLRKCILSEVKFAIKKSLRVCILPLRQPYAQSDQINPHYEIYKSVHSVALFVGLKTDVKIIIVNPVAVREKSLQTDLV